MLVRAYTCLPVYGGLGYICFSSVPSHYSLLAGLRVARGPTHNLVRQSAAAPRGGRCGARASVAGARLLLGALCEKLGSWDGGEADVQDWRVARSLSNHRWHRIQCGFVWIMIAEGVGGFASSTRA